MPFVFFYFKKQFKGVLLQKVLFLFLLGGLQGFLGWFMVKSGLSERTSVSHYRLAIHLITAFITFGFTFKVALDIIYPQRKPYDMHLKKLYRWTWITFGLLLVQIVYGAFVAGLKAGRIFNAFPKMDDDWISSSVFYSLNQQGFSALFDAMPVVQFIHRYIAYAVVFFILYLYFLAKNLNKARLGKLLTSEKLSAIRWIPIVVIFQFLLGVFTLLYAVPLWLGVLHQIGAFLLFALVVFIIHRFKTEQIKTS